MTPWCCKTLGATRAQLTAAYAIEYLLIGLATVVFAVAAGTLAADLVVTQVMEFPFVFVAGEAVGTATAALLVTVVLGLAGTFSAPRPQARRSAAKSLTELSAPRQPG